MKCPLCKENTLGQTILLEGLPANECSNCHGVFIPSNSYMAWKRALGKEFPVKEGEIEIDPSWSVDEDRMSLTLSADGRYYTWSLKEFVEEAHRRVVDDTLRAAALRFGLAAG